MRRCLLLFLILLSSSLLAQTQLTVLDGFMEDQPLSNVKVISADNHLLGKTSSDGKFLIPTSQNTVTLDLEGYIAKKVFVYGKELIVYLDPIVVELSSAQIVNTDAEARKLIRQTINHRKRNQIENLDSYEYKSYSKFLVTINKDSMPYIIFPKNAKDSSYNDIRKLLDESHLMLGERAMDHKYASKYGKKNIVKASRISGVKAPIYEFVAMQPISHNFNDDRIDFFFRQFVNPVSRLGLQEYRYRISGEEEIEGRKTILISFFPNKRIPNKQQIKGRIWIDEENKAIAKFYAENLSENSIAELDLDWTYVNQYWFPKQQRYRMDGGYMSYPTVKDSISPDGMVILDTIKKREKVWFHLSTNFKDIITPKNFDVKEFRGYTNEIDFVSMDNSDETLEIYRDETLTVQEQNTYVKIDSIGEKYKMDNKIKMLRVFTNGGKLPIGKLDWDLTKLLAYNEYEGFRLGLGGNTNYRFSQEFSLNGYLAYGFKDEKFKYGIGADWFINKPNSGKIFINYARDVMASGRNPIVLQNNYLRFLYGSLNNIYNDYYYSFKKTEIGYQQDIWENITLQLSANYTEQKPEFAYQYKDKPIDETYKLFNTQLAIRWAPKDQYIGTPYGKVTIKSGLPMFYLTVNQGLNAFNADYTSTKIDLTYFDRYRTSLGITNMQMRTGALFGDTPIMNTFEGMGNARDGYNILKRFAPAGFSNFETMYPGEFYSDKYFSVQIGHKFAGIRMLKKEIFPEFIYRGLIGDMKKPTNHHLIDFDSPKHYYQEAGVEINQLFMGVFGIGAYYRFGAYAYDNFDQNFFLKLTLRLTFF